ncbi:Major facilitator superfamily domain general substrate transporter [Penicillium rubens]|nr:Major facilitator superfamily domain general substrate transporter [Penicillium rubens]
MSTADTESHLRPSKQDVSITIGSVDIDPRAERTLVWKLDLRILPVLAIMYLFNSLDKSNLGNAKTAGLEVKNAAFTLIVMIETLSLKGNQYNLLLSIFFVPYVLTAPFLGLLGKKYGPNIVLPCMMLGFGVCTILVVAVFNFSARRLAIFYAAQTIASAFSGLLAFGIFRIETGPLAPWRYLFLIEGAATILFALFALWYLPRSASEANFLTPEEKELAYLRLQIDSSSVVNEKLDIRDAFQVFKHGTSWVILGIQVCLGVPLQSVQLFLPVIIQRLGYSTVKTNLFTVAPNISGAAVLLILAFSSDWTRWRFPFITLGFLFTFMGFIIYATIDVQHDLHVAYFASFLMTWGTSAPSVLLDAWYNNNTANEGRRVVLTSIAVPLANLMGVVSSNIFRTQDAPKYFPALITTASFGGVGIILTLCLGLWMIADNKKRDRLQGVHVKAKDIPTEYLKDGPACDNFRWFY